MIRSMTGFGKGIATIDGATLTVEIKTVNHRFCDISVKSPRLFFACETELRRRLSERLKRGKVDLLVLLEYTSGGTALPVLNLPLAQAYYQAFSELRTTLNLQGEINLDLIAGQRDVILMRENALPEEDLCRCLFVSLERAIEAVEAMRGNEGEATQRDIEGRISTLDVHLHAISARAAVVPNEWQGRLNERLTRLGPDFAYDPLRVAQEIALFADRCDISEELSRFRSHLEQVRLLLTEPEPVGRQLDFLVQELNRETNTMGSKSNDAELTRHVVQIKSELEKVREQIQNVE